MRKPPRSPYEDEIRRAAAEYDSPRAREKRDRRTRAKRKDRVRQLKEIVADHRLQQHPEWYRPREIDPKTRQERIAYAKSLSLACKADMISSAQPGWRMTKVRLMKASVEWRERLERLIRTRNPFFES